mmetsp:Transcript_10482/g.24423  ORF Transcript_10482/g.24423 Transcript_10482/m.24423 type:complete len:270 (+) Transcript_10482:1237-2046(+)
MVDEPFEERLELRGQKFIRLVQNGDTTSAQVGHALVGEVEDAARGADQYVNRRVKAHNVVLQARAASGDHALHLHVLSELAYHRGGLQGQLARGHEDEDLDPSIRHVGLLKARDDKRRGLAGAVLGASEHIPVLQDDRDRPLLYRRWPLEPLLENTHEELALQEVVLKIRVCSHRGHIRRLEPRVLLRRVQLLLPLLPVVHTMLGGGHLVLSEWQSRGDRSTLVNCAGAVLYRAGGRDAAPLQASRATEGCGRGARSGRNGASGGRRGP